VNFNHLARSKTFGITVLSCIELGEVVRRADGGVGSFSEAVARINVSTDRRFTLWSFSCVRHLHGPDFGRHFSNMVQRNWRGEGCIIRGSGGRWGVNRGTDPFCQSVRENVAKPTQNGVHGICMQV